MIFLFSGFPVLRSQTLQGGLHQAVHLPQRLPQRASSSPSMEMLTISQILGQPWHSKLLVSYSNSLNSKPRKLLPCFFLTAVFESSAAPSAPITAKCGGTITSCFKAFSKANLNSHVGGHAALKDDRGLDILPLTDIV